MGKTGAISGGVGDTVYGVPVMKHLDIDTLYIKENFYYEPYGSMYSTLKPLLEMQGIECRPTKGGVQYPFFNYEEGLLYDYDLDAARRQPNRGLNHIMISYLNQYKLSLTDWNKPWLKVEGERKIAGDYSLIHLTPRWRDNSPVNWRSVYERIEGKVYFIGFPHEWMDFVNQYGAIEHLETYDLLEMAILIRDCTALYCNQSVALTIAQGIGKDYFLERKPYKTNTVMGTKNEKLLK